MFESVWSVLLRDRGAETWLIELTLSLFTVPMIFLAPIGGRLAHQRGPMRTVVWSVSLAALCSFSYGAIHVLWILLAISLVHAFVLAMAVVTGVTGARAITAVGAFHAINVMAEGLLGVAIIIIVFVRTLRAM